MKELLFNFYGVQARIRGNEASEIKSAMDDLAEDFSFFTVKTLSGPGDLDFELILEVAPLESLAARKPLFRSRSAQVYGWGDERWAVYRPDSAVHSESSKATRHFKIYTPSADLLYELTYTAVLSATGEALDRRGFHRLHALAFQRKNQSTLFFLPHRGGKSSIASLLLSKSEALVFSDEQPLISDDRLYPFPIRMALFPEVSEKLGLPSGRAFVRQNFPTKLLYPISSDQVPQPAKADVILIGLKGKAGLENHSKFKKVSRRSAFFHLFKAVVVGDGIAQMAEHMLRLRNLPALVLIAVSRLRALISLVSTTPAHTFKVETDPVANYQSLIDFLSDKGGTQE